MTSDDVRPYSSSTFRVLFYVEIISCVLTESFEDITSINLKY